MLSLVRGGPTVLVIRTGEAPHKLVEALRQISTPRETSPMESFSNVLEGDTLIFVSARHSKRLLTYQTNLQPTAIFCDLINEKLSDAIEQVKVTPPSIFVRLLGDLDAAIDQIARDFRAKEAGRVELIKNINEKAVLVNFTTAPLNQVVKLKDIYRRALLVNKPYGQLLIYLRAKAQEYLNIAMGSPDWNEVPVTLFDAIDQFNLHYQRLITVLQALELGVISGENWVPEYTIALRKSEVYRVDLLTPFEPQRIKRIAMGLEYDDEGRRVVDFDVYDEKKKISWTSEKPNHPGRTRADIGMFHRREILSQMPGESRAYLARLDAQIDKTKILRNR